MVFISGALSARLSPTTPSIQPRRRSTWSAVMVVKSSRSSASREGPMKAKGAISAPTLTPLTMWKVGRVPWAVQPVSSPAPKAPFSPPPDSARICLSSSGSAEAGRPMATWRRRVASARPRSIASVPPGAESMKRSLGMPRAEASAAWPIGTAGPRGSGRLPWTHAPARPTPPRASIPRRVYPIIALAVIRAARRPGGDTWGRRCRNQMSGARLRPPSPTGLVPPPPRPAPGRR